MIMEKDAPKISIITVTFNASLSLEQTIDSVVKQSYKNIEFIIVDGGSTDGTVDLLKKYEGQITHWISEPDHGVYDAMNKAVTMATGSWVYFLGSGDLLVDGLDNIAPLLVDKNCIYYGDVYRQDLSAVYGGKFSGFRLAVSNICHQAIFYPAGVFRKRKYDLKYKIQADHAFNMLCYGDKQYRFKHFPIIVCLYEGNGYSDKVLDYSFFEDKIKLVKSNFSIQVYIYALFRRTIGRLITAKYNKPADLPENK
jgi:glycosyltransferase involved in cell wall biosynthesis